MPERRFSLSLPAQVRHQTERYLSDLRTHLSRISAPQRVKPVFYPWGSGVPEENTRLPVGDRIDQQIKSKRLEGMVDFFENMRGRAMLGISPFGHLKFDRDFYPPKWRRWAVAPMPLVNNIVFLSCVACILYHVYSAVRERG